MSDKRPNIHTLLLVSLIGIIAFFGKKEIAKNEDTYVKVVEIQSNMVTRREYDNDMLALRAEMGMLRVRIVSIELAIDRIKKIN